MIRNKKITVLLICFVLILSIPFACIYTNAQTTKEIFPYLDYYFQVNPPEIGTTISIYVKSYVNGQYRDIPRSVNALQSTVNAGLSDSTVEAYRILDELGQTEIENSDDGYREDHPNAVLIESATLKFNCHSYAWYDQDIDENCYWINDPYNFYKDGRYIEVSEPQVGDKVCYIYENMNTHSEIVTDLQISSGVTTVKVTSKWGSGGLYEHNLTDCPYFNQDVTIKYYRDHDISCTSLGIEDGHRAFCSECNWSYSGDHNYEFVSSTSASYHYYRCDECRQEYSENHTFACMSVAGVPGHKRLCTLCTTSGPDMSQYIRRDPTLLEGHAISDCAFCSYTYFEPHDWVEQLTNFRCSICGFESSFIPAVTSSIPADILAKLDRISADQNRAVMFSGNTVLCRVNGEYYLVKGQTAETAVQYVLTQLDLIA